MNVAFVTIATEKYKAFVPRLLDSINKFAFKGNITRTFVFSDGDIPDHDHIHIDALPWPLTTLLKFRNFNSLPWDKLAYDYVYFIDSDMEVCDVLDEEILPPIGQLSAVEHPWQRMNSAYYETNPMSTACVTDNKGSHYFQACFFGGHVSDVSKMSIELARNIEIDLRNNIIAKYHDESHLNRYLVDHPPKQLNAGYAYPDPVKWNREFPVTAKIYHDNQASL